MKSKVLLASMLSGFAAVAAAQVVIGPVGLDPTVANQSKEFNIPVKSVFGFFTDTINFEFSPTVPWSSSAVGTGVHIKLISTPEISFTVVSLNGTAGTVNMIGDADANVSFFSTPSVNFNPLNNPAYVLSISGTADVGGTYGGTLNVAVVPVPEPETYLMMLAGLGAVGFLVARRRNRA
jgi:hypothetical protein